jgi:glutamate-1-semialdehyde 2,1-aminomutase
VGIGFSVSEFRGRCVTTGSYFFWLHPELIDPKYQTPTKNEMTLVGIESLLTLREACEDAGLTTSDVEDIFLNNSLRYLQPHLPATVAPAPVTGKERWNEAREVISGGTGLLSKRAEMFGADHWPAYFEKSAGCEVWDLSGKRYIDFAGGVGAVFLGYADPDVNAAVHRRLMQGSYATLVNPQEVTLAKKLLHLHPWAGKVRYARGGGEAMTMAVRIGRAATGRSGVAFCGYHGWHDWYLASNLGNSEALDGHLLPGLEPKGVPRELTGTSVPFRYNDFESFEAALEKLGDNLAVVVMEPMRSEFPKDDFVAKVAARCRELGAVFIVDEVTSGLRYGFPGALSKLGVEPDVVVYAKAYSNGIPFGAIIGREEIMVQGEAGFISSSYWTDGLGTAAALAVIEKMESQPIHEVVWERGVRFKQALEEIAARYPACQLKVGGMPVSPTFQFQLGSAANRAKSELVRRMVDRGFLVSSALYLMYAHQETHIDQFLSALEEVLRDMEQVILVKGGFGEGHSESNAGFSRLV